MSALRRVEATVPAHARQHVIEALTTRGGIGHETHVGEQIVVHECENAVCVISVTCSSLRAGELMRILTSHGVGVLFGTLTSLVVASQRPNPIALVAEFKALKAKIERRAQAEETTNHRFKHKWDVSRKKLAARKMAYVTVSTGKSMEELFNEVVDQGTDGREFYGAIVCASVIAGVGLLSNSAVVVLSAMLISPLMGPLLASAFGASISDSVMFLGSLIAEFRAACVTFGVGALVGIVYGPYAVKFGDTPIPTAEMMSRGERSGLVGGVIIAFASGIVLANAITKSGINSLVGVAISASLLPPIVNSGIMVVFGLGISSVCRAGDDDMCTATPSEFFEMALYSFALYAVNVVVIVCTAWAIFALQKVGAFKSLWNIENDVLLDKANKHVRAKLQIATGIKGALDEETFNKFLDDAKAPKRQKSQKEVLSSSDTKDAENATGETLNEFDNSIPPDARMTSEFSILRPFPEPYGVKRPEFADGENAILKNLHGWVGRVHHLLQR
jgi:hypothetical protein